MIELADDELHNCLMCARAHIDKSDDSAGRAELRRVYARYLGEEAAVRYVDNYGVSASAWDQGVRRSGGEG